MFTFNCPHCGVSVNAEEKFIGQIADCPRCNGQVQIPSPPRQIVIIQPQAPQKKDEKDHIGDFCLGFFFSIIGVLISLVISGSKGAQMAFWGMLLQIVLAILLLAVA